MVLLICLVVAVFVFPPPLTPPPAPDPICSCFENSVLSFCGIPCLREHLFKMLRIHFFFFIKIALI